MINMPGASSRSLLGGSEFEPFLLAPIGEDKNGMLLSVLSALARLDIDPWEEAAGLARLPGDSATRKLASLIAALPAVASAREDSETIAARLISLLPRHSAAEVQSGTSVRGIANQTRSPSVINFILYIIFTFAMLVSHWLVVSRQAPAQTQTGSATVPAANHVSAHPPP